MYDQLEKTTTDLKTPQKQSQQTLPLDFSPSCARQRLTLAPWHKMYLGFFNLYVEILHWFQCQNTSLTLLNPV